MTERQLNSQHLVSFREHLVREEKSTATIEKYIRDTHGFLKFAAGREITKELTLLYKSELQKKGYAVRSVNSMLASLNSLMDFLGWTDCKVKTLRCQRQTYCSEDKELFKAEYMRLLEASKHQQHQYHAHLYHDHRNRTPQKDRTAWSCGVGKINII